MNASKIHDQNGHIVSGVGNGQNEEIAKDHYMNGSITHSGTSSRGKLNLQKRKFPQNDQIPHQSEFIENQLFADQTKDDFLVKDSFKVPQKNLISDHQICTNQNGENMLNEIQNKTHASRRKGDMTVEANTQAELLKANATNSTNLTTTPCSADLIGIENPEYEKPNKRQSKALDKDKLNSQLNTSTRPKRETKQIRRPDELYDNDIPDCNERITKKTPKSINIKHQKIDDTKDPIHLMNKTIMEPIISYDKLEVLFRDKVPFEIKLKAKDLKNFSKERKEELLTQRVNFEQHDGFIIQLNLDPNFERHIEPPGQLQLSSSDLKIDSKTPSTDNNEMEENSGDEDNQGSAEKEMEDDEKNREDNDNSPNDAEFKKPKNRKKKGRKNFTRGYQRSSSGSSKKSYQTHLPSSLTQQTWLENTENNIILLRQQNQEILKKKEQRKLEEQKKQFEEEQKKLEEQKKKFEEEQKKAELKNLVEETMSKLNDKGQEEKKQENQETEDTKMNIDENPQSQKQETQEKEIPQETQNVNQEVIITPFGGENRTKDEHFMDVYDTNLISIDQIQYKYLQNYYHSLDTLLKDYSKLITNTIKNRCKNQLSKIYLTNLMINASKVIQKEKKQWIAKWNTYYSIKLANNQISNALVGGDDFNVWYNKFDESTKRQYFEIEDYKIQVPGKIEQNQQMSQQQLREAQRIREIMQTSKTSKCEGDCCVTPISKEDQQPDSLILGVQNYKCACCRAKTECSDECGCDPDKCLNRQMTAKQSLVLGIDVEEKISWGMDTCTAVNFISICPRDIDRSQFVEKKLIYAIQQQDTEGYNVLKALQYIINCDLKDPILSTKYNRNDIEVAQALYDAIENLPEKNIKHFRIHSKGLGIFCKNINGIRNDSLVIEYFGEIYRQWHWFEKQDVIKKGQNDNKLNKGLPDFYNITFERHLDDPDGYNIMTVDPILHGNYSSRLSHSCSPNCQTINKVRNGKYSIGMFTNKDISYGEELCFDYCSFTESQVEFDEAICLCGTAQCKSKYLTLSNDKNNLQIMKNHHTFIDRNFLIFKAVTQSELTQEDRQRLADNGLGQSVLNCAPLWLQKWASLVCEYLEFEEHIFPETFKNDYPKDMKIEHIKIDARGQRDTQVQNIAITIDKIMHVLESMKTYDPPIRVLSYEERYKKLWEEPQCIKHQVREVLDQIEKPGWDSQVDQALNLLTSMDTQAIQLQMGSEEQMECFFKEKYDKVRKILENISNILRSVNSIKVPIPAFCDVLMMYAYTETYFTQNQNYRKCDSDLVIIRNCDVRHKPGANMDKINQGKTAYSNNKEYDSQYVWGQLVGWNKQTVEQPNASLSADRRGTLSIPDITSFISYDSIAESSAPKQKKGKRQDSDEVFPTGGSRSRPQKSVLSSQIPNKNQTPVASSVLVDNAVEATKDEILNQTQDQFTKPQSRSGGVTRQAKIVYPSKRYCKRQEFLQNWRETFSKQFDVCCKWQFKNKFKMYGSIQFESVVKSDRDIWKMKVNNKDEQIARYQKHMGQRLQYFDETVKRMLNYKHE